MARKAAVQTFRGIISAGDPLQPFDIFTNFRNTKVQTVKRLADTLSLVAILILMIGSATLSATPPDDQLSPADAEEVVSDLIGLVTDYYDCEISFESMQSDFEVDWVQYSMLVRLAGKECSAALRDLQNRGESFRLSFGEQRPIEAEVDSSLQMDN
jgi:hypothetical protein